MKHILFLFLFFLSMSFVLGDVYMHNPRGCNNRNRETSVNTDNPDRMFDSQNNNKGGYCWGPPMTFYEGSLLQVEWTAQHGCGVDNPNTDCELILQYMCHTLVRDGTETDTITEATKDTKGPDLKMGGQAYLYGMHEPYEFYKSCSQRIRNRGLFIADQGLRNDDTAMRTRQENNQNNPHGTECEEERDYYPYWHPSPWRDIAVLTSNTNRCDYFKKHSQNVEGKFECTGQPKQNNQAECVAAGGQWSYTGPWNIAAPECYGDSFSRDNHLGNGRTGHTASYSWIIPRLNTLGAAYLNSDGTANCALRLRYNITAGDYPGWNEVDGNDEMIDSSYNAAKSPVKQDPYIVYGKDRNNYDWQLRLALNTDQYSRTFEDRSYTFFIAPRPTDITESHRIFNLNVRGKRGNIVESFPAVEYDFTPGDLKISIGDYIHFQWTGCDTNPNYAGEGTQRTDRSNIVEVKDRKRNIPISNIADQTMFDSEDIAFKFAHLNQYGGAVCSTVDQQSCCKTLEQLKAAGGDIDQNVQNCMKLNDPTKAYFNGGAIQMKKKGTYSYMSTRNNNFTNRSQKGTITVEPLLPTWGVVMASIGAAGFVIAAVVAGGYYYAVTHPTSAVANFFAGVKI